MDGMRPTSRLAVALAAVCIVPANGQPSFTFTSASCEAGCRDATCADLAVYCGESITWAMSSAALCPGAEPPSSPSAPELDSVPAPPGV